MKTRYSDYEQLKLYLQSFGNDNALIKLWDNNQRLHLWVNRLDEINAGEAFNLLLLAYENTECNFFSIFVAKLTKVYLIEKMIDYINQGSAPEIDYQSKEFKQQCLLFRLYSMDMIKTYTSYISRIRQQLAAVAEEQKKWERFSETSVKQPLRIVIPTDEIGRPIKRPRLDLSEPIQESATAPTDTIEAPVFYDIEQDEIIERHPQKKPTF